MILMTDGLNILNFKKNDLLKKIKNQLASISTHVGKFFPWLMCDGKLN
jgi:hypothetical protein